LLQIKLFYVILGRLLKIAINREGIDNNRPFRQMLLVVHALTSPYPAHFASKVAYTTFFSTFWRHAQSATVQHHTPMPRTIT
jgi:hypothetical protein